MDSRLLQHTMRWLSGLCLLALGSAASAAAPALVSILQGDATLVRQTTRYALAEGVALALETRTTAEDRGLASRARPSCVESIRFPFLSLCSSRAARA